jgi:hypothetical protein
MARFTVTVTERQEGAADPSGPLQCAPPVLDPSAALQSVIRAPSASVQSIPGAPSPALQSAVDAVTSPQASDPAEESAIGSLSPLTER